MPANRRDDALRLPPEHGIGEPKDALTEGLKLVVALPIAVERLTREHIRESLMGNRIAQDCVSHSRGSSLVETEQGVLLFRRMEADDLPF